MTGVQTCALPIWLSLPSVIYLITLGYPTLSDPNVPGLGYSWVKGNQVGFGYYLNFWGRIWILRKPGLYWKNLNLFLLIVTLFLSTNLFLCPVFILPPKSLFHLRLTTGMLFFFLSFFFLLLFVFPFVHVWVLVAIFCFGFIFRLT